MTRKILLAEVMHETNTFNRIATTKRDFETRYWHEGAAIPMHLAGTNTEIAGFLEAAEHHDWQLVHSVAASASPSGPLCAADWQRLLELINGPLETEQFEAVILVLHGAMVTETSLDPEGDLITGVRATVGPQTLIAVTLDMHANVSRAMTDNANLMMAYRTYPHIDQRERALHMADLIETVLQDTRRPHVHLARRAMIDGANHGQTATGQPMPGLLARAAGWEARDDILCASIQIGFPWADVADIGPSVAVSSWAPEPARAAADDLVEALWQSRNETQLDFPTPHEAMVEALRGQPGDRPLVLADFADNPAGGAYGDSANLLREMIMAGLSNAAFATISDPQAVAMAQAVGPGATIELKLGGNGAPDLTPPLRTRATVQRLGDGDFVCAGPMWQGVAFSMGPSAVLSIAGIEVIVSSVPTSVMDLNVFRAMGIEPADKTTLAVKSRNHFKAAYEPIARKTMLVDAGGIASMRLGELDYHNIPRPIWPLDDAG